MSYNVTQNFLDISNGITKNPVLVIQVEGLNDVISSQVVLTALKYGMPGVTYGGVGPDGNPYVYGELIPGTGTATISGTGFVRPYLMLDRSSVAITQKIEQEQGRCSISQMTLSFIDKDSYMTQLLTPGVFLTEPLGAQIRVYLGYKEVSFPQDFTTIFRGNIQGYSSQAGMVTLELGDPNLKKRQSLFFIASTELTSDITDSTTTIPVINNGDFIQQIIGPDSTVDPGVRAFILIDSEWIEYDRLAYQPNSFNQSMSGVVTRGARNTIPAMHTAGSMVTAGIEITGNVVDIMLKLMISGWGGFYKTLVPITSIVITGDPALGPLPNGVILAAGVDAIYDLGLTIGDYVTIVGDSIPGNNVTGKIVRFATILGQINNAFVLDQTLTSNSPSSATLSLRSQYDTYPSNAGLKMFPYEIDIVSHIYYRNSFLNSDFMDFFITTQEDSGKTFIEKELALPVSAYCITKAGQVSLKVTLPPLAGQVLTTLNASNVINPTQMRVDRSTTTRRFFNEIDYSYNPDDDGNFQNFAAFLDTDSLNEIGYSNTLPITSRGTRTGALIAPRATKLLNRYKRGCIYITLSCTFGVGVTIEPGDIIILTDNGGLQISNFTTGVRDVGTALYEVIERTFDYVNCKTDLVLLSGLNFGPQDRFATWSPGSQIQNSGSTTSAIIVKPSYGALYGTAEYLKWQTYVGLNIVVHSTDFTTFYQQVKLIAVSNANVLTVDPPLPSIPLDNYIVDLAPYPNNTDPNDQLIAKIKHVFWDKTGTVVTVTDASHFSVSSLDAPYFVVGYPLFVHSPDYSNQSAEVLITAVSGTSITCEPLGYVPAPGDLCELLSFKDGGQPYRWI